MQIYLYQENQQVGPYTLDQIKELMASGKVSHDTPSWHDGLSEWVPVTSLMPVVTKANLPPPIPNPPASKANNNRFGWKTILIVAFILVLVGGCVVGAGVYSYLSGRVPEGSVPEISTPQDPGDNKVSSAAFTIVQVISPGRALVQRNYGVFSAMVHGLSDDGVGNANPDQVYLLAGVPATVVDGDTWKGEFFENGIYTYTTTDNGSKTVRSLVVVDVEAEKVAQQKRANEEQAEAQKEAEEAEVQREAQDEKTFTGFLSDARKAISNTQLGQAQDLLKAAEQMKPDDGRLADLREKLKTSQFDVATKLFENAIQTRDIVAALRELTEAKELSPYDKSIVLLQSQLDGLKMQILQDIDTKLAAHDIAGASNEYAVIAATFPNETRLSEYNGKLIKAKFDALVVAFHQAIKSQNVDVASATFDEASALNPNEASLGSLQDELTEARFLKESIALKSFLGNAQFIEAKAELSKLKALNVKPEQISAFSSQLGSGIKTAISSIVNRGKDAFAANNVDQASQALADAAGLDSTNPEVVAFEADFTAKKQWKKGLEAAQHACDSNPDNSEAVQFLAVAKNSLNKQNQDTATTLLAQAKDAAVKLDWNQAFALSNDSIEQYPLPEAKALSDKASFMLLPVLNAHNLYLECKKLQALQAQNHVAGRVDFQTNLSIKIGQLVRFSGKPLNNGISQIYEFNESFATGQAGSGASFALGIESHFSVGPVTTLRDDTPINIQGTISNINCKLYRGDSGYVNIGLNNCQIVP
jgi:hypothetical protein